MNPGRKTADIGKHVRATSVAADCRPRRLSHFKCDPRGGWIPLDSPIRFRRADVVVFSFACEGMNANPCARHVHRLSPRRCCTERYDSPSCRKKDALCLVVRRSVQSRTRTHLYREQASQLPHDNRVTAQKPQASSGHRPSLFAPCLPRLDPGQIIDGAALDRAFEDSLLSRNQSKIGHAQEETMFYYSGDGIDLTGDRVGVIDEHAGTIED